MTKLVPILGVLAMLVSPIAASAQNFAGADLTHASFVGSFLEGANLSGARLDGTNFSGAELGRARGLTQGQLDRACGDGQTELPRGLRIPRC